MTWVEIFAGLIPSAIMLLGMLTIAGFMYLGRFPISRKKRKSPFTVDFLRAPGQSLGAKIEDLRFDAVGYLMTGALVPIVLFAAAVASAYFKDRQISSTVWVFYVSLTVLILGWTGWKTFRAGKRVRHLLLGYEGEVAVGQELNQLLRHQFRVYHDFPADQFNIDHIVIGPTGVFAVETKARPKPNTGDGRKDARVEFDGHRLVFPAWTETAPLEQARRQANWLRAWIKSAVAEPVSVIPVLALPGWFVDRKRNGDVLISSGRDVESLFLRYNRTPGLDPKLIQMISHQVEGKCRNVVPRAYRKAQKAFATR